jgi:16S rRNA (cytosine1402-N4)-methyltransferase
MLVENSDEPYAEEIADTVMKWFAKGKEIETTTDLKNAITEALSFLPEKEQKEAVKKSCQRTFQALRIDVNSEFEVLYEFLEKLPSVLAPGGRVAVLTFHSGEDRLVKKAFKEYHRQGIFSDVARDVIRPSQEECFKNSRAKSTKMRWAVKNAEC